jgi:hypothetical protein
MDKKLLDSLNNLSIALQDISDSLNSKSEASSATAKAMKGGDFGKEIKEINIGVIQLKKDTKQILANQQTIMNMGKNKSKGADVAEGLGKDKQKQKNFKEGIGVILLIAVAVLALGIAFNLVGKVNFLSVIALSIALPLLAIGFSKVHTVLKQVGFEAKKDGLNFVLAMVAISTSITLSSWILSLIKPIGFLQAVTGILIGAMFYVISNSMENIFIGVAVFHRLKISPVKLVMSLVAISTAITVSSWVLSMIRPMSFAQSITAILIAAMFAVIGFSFHKIAAGVAAFKATGVKAKDLLLVLVGISAAITASSWILGLIRPLDLWQAVTGILISLMFLVIAFNLDKIAAGVIAFKKTGVKATDLLLVLVGISAAITASSWVLSLIVPIGIWQFLTALGIALLFALMSYIMPELAAGIYIIEKSLGKKGLFLMPLIFVAISIAIMLSSHILQKTAEIKFTTLLRVLALGIILALITTAFTPAMFILGKIGIKNLLLGGLGVVIIATAIMASSLILSYGSYKKYPDWKWALSVGLSLLAFIPAIIALGIISMTGVGALAILAGSGMVLLVAASIVATSHILAMGKYNKYPPLMWTLGTVAAMAPFALAMVALGIIALSGVGAVAMVAGAIAVLGVATTIVATSKILSKGKYSGGPPLSWTLSTGLVMTGFGLAVLTLGSFIVGTLGFGWLALKAGSKAVSMIAHSIVDASIILQKGKYTKGPTKEWAEGIAIALGAFAPVYSMLMNSGVLSIFGVKGVSPKDFAKAIITVSGGIIDAAGFFAKNSAVFKNGPSKAWSEGVGLAIGAFAPVYKMLVDFPFTGGKKMSAAIITISKGIIKAAEIFGKNKSKFDEGNYPSVKWGRGVGAALNAFAPVFRSLSKDTGWFTSGEDVINNMVNGVVKISKAIVRVGYLFSKSNLKWDSYPSKKWSWNVKNAIGSFIRLVKSVGNEDISYDGLVRNASQMSRVAGILWRSKKFFQSKIDPSYIKNMTTNIKDFSKMVKYLNAGFLSKDDKLLNAFGLDPASRAALGMTRMASAFDKLASSLNKFSSAIKSVDGQKINMIRKLTGNIAILSSMDSKMFNNMMTVLERRSSVFSKLLDSPRSGGGLSVGDKPGGGQREVWAKKKDQGPTDSRGENMLTKLDRISKLLDSINKNVDTVDDLVLYIMTKKKDEKLGKE